MGLLIRAALAPRNVSSLVAAAGDRSLTGHQLPWHNSAVAHLPLAVPVPGARGPAPARGHKLV
jgi:hypothetical protein